MQKPPPLRSPISIHAPVKGATGLHRLVGLAAYISIHAPVKGATGPRLLTAPVLGISIHAPVKGATTAANIIFTNGIFQSTLP